ncbi:hypothetical protein ACFQZJ_13010 [Maribacter chungangensis]|uniref:Uncharacterized protein n=1 Tax=Maribacter chungangensis TaxID=1069117 RepID=A0ABW3B5P0_9FLAO
MRALPAFICIPDTSGLTQFMSDANFKLSSEFIPALPNNFTYPNETGLNVSEIKGDAVLFF